MQSVLRREWTGADVRGGTVAEPREYSDQAQQDLLEAFQQSRRRVAELTSFRKRLENRLRTLRQADDATELAAVEAQLRDLATQQESADRQAQELQAAVEKYGRG